MSPPVIGSRRLFPELGVTAYLNHAAISPISSPVREALHRSVQRYEIEGVHAFPEHLAQRERLREKLAALICARGDEIALLPNTSAGVIAVAMCFPWQPRDRVVVLEGEFPTNVTPWQRAAVLHDLRLEMLPAPDPSDPSKILEPLEAALRAGVRLLALSAVQFQTGVQMPLSEIGALCRRYGTAFFVDAIQACGVVPLAVDPLGIDFLACGSHKWLMGIEGGGFLYARDAPQYRLRPHLAAWLSHEHGLDFLFHGDGHLRYDRPIKSGPQMLEGGTSNALGFVALEASLDLLDQIGIPAIYDHVQRYHDVLEPALCERGFQSARCPQKDGRSGILSVRAPAQLDIPSLPARLREHGVSIAIPDGWVRFSPHWPNATTEVAWVCQAFDALLAS